MKGFVIFIGVMIKGGEMIVEIPICPVCKKEISSSETVCHHCSKYVGALKFKSVFSWEWADRLFIVFSAFLFFSFFLPWFPGQFLSQETPLSPCNLLLNLINLEVDFLESYDILRMLVIVPLFSLLLFLMVYLKRMLMTTPFPGLFLIACILSAGLTIIFQSLSGLSQWGAIFLFFLGFVFSLVRCHKKGVLGRISFCLLFVFMIGSVFLYLFDIATQLYSKLNPLVLADTWGFFAAWIIALLFVLTAAVYYMRSAEDVWLLLFTLVFSLIAYAALVHPLFVSGPARFIADNFQRIGIQTAAHIRIVFIALIIAIFAGLPAGIYITRHPGVAGFVLYISSILITIPSIAMFGFMMPILSSIDNAWDAVNGIGIGVVPATAALSLYSLLPIIRNTYIALNNVDPATIEAGRGMGMTNFQLLVKLQLPLSAPIIMAGVRTAVVMGIAIAAVAAYIGAGGLGLFISEGLQMSTNESVIAGAIAMSLLAIVADIFLSKAEDWVTPTGLKVKQAKE